MLVVLNQADKLTADEQLTITTDLGRLLHDDGVGDVVIRTISARTGDGVEDLRDDIQRAVAAQSMAARRLDEELGRIARLMRSATPSGAIEDLSLTTSQEIDRFAVAAGVDTVKDTIESATLADRATELRRPSVRPTSRQSTTFVTPGLNVSPNRCVAGSTQQPEKQQVLPSNFTMRWSPPAHRSPSLGGRYQVPAQCAPQPLLPWQQGHWLRLLGSCSRCSPLLLWESRSWHWVWSSVPGDITGGAH